MIKKLATITGTQEISKKSQKKVNGGMLPPPTGSGPQCYYYNKNNNNNGAVCDTPQGLNGKGRCATGVCSPDA